MSPCGENEGVKAWVQPQERPQERERPRSELHVGTEGPAEEATGASQVHAEGSGTAIGRASASGQQARGI